MLHIDIWADFACPACYLAKPRIDQAIAASGHADAITVTYRSLELFPDAGPGPFDSFEHVLHKFGGDQAKAARLEKHMAALARARGQPYAVQRRAADQETGDEVGIHGDVRSVPVLLAVSPFARLAETTPRWYHGWGSPVTQPPPAPPAD
jgi:hypothetical protein